MTTHKRHDNSSDSLAVDVADAVRTTDTVRSALAPAQGLDARLSFAIRLAHLDLATLSPGDWLNLQRDLALFFQAPEVTRICLEDRVVAVPTGTTGWGIGARPTPPATPAVLAALQSEVRAILTSVAAHGPVAFPVAIQTRKRLLFPPATVDTPFPGAVVVVDGPVRDVFLDSLLRLLTTVAPDRVRRCPECDTIFLRVRKQLYCSRRCVNRANKRAWLATPKGKRASQSSRRRSYVKKVEKRFGRKVRVRLNGSRKGHA